MDVHDTPSIPKNIECPQGVVITVEPGIYVRPENTAVRKEFRGLSLPIIVQVDFCIQVLDFE